MGSSISDPAAGQAGGPAEHGSLAIEVFTIFPGLIAGFARESLLGRAQERGVVRLRTHDLRDHTADLHRSVDDAPFGGGAGMVMTPEPIFAAVEAADPPRPLLLLGPSGRRFDQAMATELAGGEGFSLLCGRYEAIDARVRDHLVDDEVSLGDFVLSGGEVAALAIIEAVARLVPGVMGNASSAAEESFTDGLLEYPHYTRPAEFRGRAVPDVLRSGDHARVARWRRAQSLARTVAQRPDLIEARGGLTDADRALLAEFGL
ncbi:MAG: tRNA (guanosine(37)-N1)-methyltransferase TrmD [Microthrixaceae bacterium]